MILEVLVHRSLALEISVPGTNLVCKIKLQRNSSLLLCCMLLDQVVWWLSHARGRGNNTKNISPSTQLMFMILQYKSLFRFVYRVFTSFTLAHVTLLSNFLCHSNAVTPRLQQRQDPLPAYVITSRKNPPRPRDL